jgi:hypothetical protein
VERSLRQNVLGWRRSACASDARSTKCSRRARRRAQPIATSGNTDRNCRRRSRHTSPDSLVAELDDGRIVNVSYRPTQNGCWVSTHEDITERAQNEARIAHLAFHDQLTGLPNRTAFNERIASTLESATGDASFAVLCVDIDQFKEINDVYGHSDRRPVSGGSQPQADIRLRWIVPRAAWG